MGYLQDISQVFFWNNFPCVLGDYLYFKFKDNIFLLDSLWAFDLAKSLKLLYFVGFDDILVLIVIFFYHSSLEHLIEQFLFSDPIILHQFILQLQVSDSVEKQQEWWLFKFFRWFIADFQIG